LTTVLIIANKISRDTPLHVKDRDDYFLHTVFAVTVPNHLLLNGSVEIYGDGAQGRIANLVHYNYIKLLLIRFKNL
jgi:hypothetical protein